MDNTLTLQSALNKGDVTLTAGATYNVTGLNVLHSLNMNGAIIIMNGLSNAAIKLTEVGASISNGTIKGIWDNTTPGNPNGPIGIRILADNCSITNMTVTGVAAYGILCGPYNKPSITNCTITNTGYIGFYYDSEANTTGGVFSYNIVDRSMIPYTSIQQGAVMIRASTATTNFVTTKWTIIGNTMKMPLSPTDWTAECMELRWISNSTVNGNTFSQGSIGCSVVRGSNITLSNNKFANQNLEAIEFADSTNCYSQSDIISSSLGVGYLLDGSIGCNTITITNPTILNTKKECIHAYLNTNNLILSGGYLYISTYGINAQSTNNINVNGTVFSGIGGSTAALLLDTCLGNVTMKNCIISNTKYFISLYNSKSLLTDNINTSGSIFSGVSTLLNKVIPNGSSIGVNINLN